MRPETTCAAGLADGTTAAALVFEEGVVSGAGGRVGVGAAALALLVDDVAAALAPAEAEVADAAPNRGPGREAKSSTVTACTVDALAAGTGTIVGVVVTTGAVTDDVDTVEVAMLSIRSPYVSNPSSLSCTSSRRYCTCTLHASTPPSRWKAPCPLLRHIAQMCLNLHPS